ncbi:XRE family transcriptional regulator [Candidimonas sp. SYP-B2681]|uniref:helix-turn-helix domain-containing protein n=1 Tax=Candidimonas sp. SYP-B2681 TaxID=2497686 RepID=UPI000F896376|nr:helix-turn-helix transcriptional regulator [Candidimonas sp. SYP-B2681]RTZ47678.1 XRE family transcriptional regulator [Candidimonas sp. SYP-B2681]
MAKKLDDAKAAIPAAGKKRLDTNAMEMATLKDLRKAAKQTQEDLASALGVGQDTISRLEKRSDMLLSTLRHYVQSVGGKLQLVATFPNRPPVIIDRLDNDKAPRDEAAAKPVASRNGLSPH